MFFLNTQFWTTLLTLPHFFLPPFFCNYKLYCNHWRQPTTTQRSTFSFTNVYRYRHCHHCLLAPFHLTVHNDAPNHINRQNLIMMNTNSNHLEYTKPHHTTIHHITPTIHQTIQQPIQQPPVLRTMMEKQLIWTCGTPVATRRIPCAPWATRTVTSSSCSLA